VLYCVDLRSSVALRFSRRAGNHDDASRDQRA